MSLNLEDVKGLGKKAAESLKEAGIDTVEKLANTPIEKLLEIKGIGKASAQKFLDGAKEITGQKPKESTVETPKKETEVEEKKDKKTEEEEEKRIKEEIKKLEEKKKRLQGQKVKEGDFVLVKVTAKTQKGTIFQVSSEEDAKKAGLFDENKAKQGYYTPEFVVVGKPGFLVEGISETLKNMNYFEKMSIRVPPEKAFGKRDPQKIERVAIAKFKKLNDGKNPEPGKEFVDKKGQRGIVTNIVQGKVIIDYNHGLAGQPIDYNLEVVDKIEEFEDKIHYFMNNKGIPKTNVSEFKINHLKDSKTLEITVPKMFLFQNLVYIKFGLAMDLQTYMGDEIENVKFIEIFEKIPIPETPKETIAKKVEEFNKEKETTETKESQSAEKVK